MSVTVGGLELLAFYAGPERARAVAAAGIDRFVVDLERRSKGDRQAGYDTQLNAHTTADIVEVVSATSGAVTCRIDALSDDTAAEIDAVVAAGADEILVPMVRRVGEVDVVLDLVAGRAATAVMIETAAAVAGCAEILDRPLSRAYLGMHDLWIDRGTRHMFEALVDGTVDVVASVAESSGVPFGFGGLTRLDRGWPLPAEHMVNALARAGASFTFLRRSFERDVPDDGLHLFLASAGDALRAARRRSAAEVDEDQARLRAACRSLPEPPWTR